ncbi:hypothetical protein IC575_030324 [Cucumis melo]
MPAEGNEVDFPSFFFFQMRHLDLSFKGKGKVGYFLKEELHFDGSSVFHMKKRIFLLSLSQILSAFVALFCFAPFQSL